MTEIWTSTQFWSAWTFESWLTIPLGIAVLLYLAGMKSIWQRAGVGRGIETRHAVSFFSAVLALVVILASPLGLLSEELFSAHMVQHMLLTFVAAPLLVQSNFPLALLWALPRHGVQSFGYVFNRSQLARLWQGLTSPIFAWLLFAMVFWLWHTSRFYEAALEHAGIHILEHILFLVAAMLFWRVVLQPTEQKHRHYGMLVFYLFTTILQSGILGALMTFASSPWYSFYEKTAAHWGLTALQDQQMGGLIMWIIGGAVLTLLDIGYFGAWLRALEKRSSRVHPNSFQRRPELKAQGK